jgi:hypothetical protein
MQLMGAACTSTEALPSRPDAMFNRDHTSLILLPLSQRQPVGQVYAAVSAIELALPLGGVARGTPKSQPPLKLHVLSDPDVGMWKRRDKRKAALLDRVSTVEDNKDNDGADQIPPIPAAKRRTYPFRAGGRGDGGCGAVPLAFHDGRERKSAEPMRDG